MSKVNASDLQQCQDIAPGGWSELLGPQYGLAALALTGAVAMHAINVHIVTTVLPSVVQEIGGLQWYAWNTTLFVVASIVGAAVSVKLLSMSGPRLAMLSALFVFTIGTLLCATAQNMPSMLLGRTIQGLGGGTFGALSYSLIRMVFPPHLWPRAIALVSGMWGVATLSGPAVGGIFAQSNQWRWAFGALLPLLALQMLLVNRQLRAERMLVAVGKAPVKIAIHQISYLALSALLIASASVVDGVVLQCLCVAAGLAFGIFAILRERSAVTRLFPAGGTSLHHPLGLLYAVVALLLMGTMTEIYVPYFLQHLHGLKPLTAGYITALLAAGWSLASVFFSGKTGKSARILMQTGPALCTLGLVLLAIAMRLPSSIALSVSALALSTIGLGVGMAWPHVLNAIMQSANADDADAASSAISTAQLYGMAIGAALVGLVVNAMGISAEADAASASQSAALLFAVFAIFPALGTLYVRRFLKRTKA